MRGHEDRRWLSEGSGARAGQREALEEELGRPSSPKDPVRAYSDGPKHYPAGAALLVLERSSSRLHSSQADSFDYRSAGNRSTKGSEAPTHL